jgi:hypothetical protein
MQDEIRGLISSAPALLPGFVPETQCDALRARMAEVVAAASPATSQPCT